MQRGQSGVGSPKDQDETSSARQPASILQFRKSNKRQPQKKPNTVGGGRREAGGGKGARPKGQCTGRGWHRIQDAGRRTQDTTRLICIAHAASLTQSGSTTSLGPLNFFHDSCFGSLFAQQMHPMQFFGPQCRRKSLLQSTSPG